MPDRLVADLTGACPGRVEADVSLAEMTTLKVGGPARALLTAETDDDLAAAGRICGDHGVPWLVVGRGSNLLVADAGWDGVAIVLGRGFRGHTIDGATVSAGAAEPMPILAAKLARAGLGGFAWAAGVPGSVGGAVRMNAGAHGTEMKDRLVAADVVRLRTGHRERIAASDLGLSYRHSDLPDDAIVVAAILGLTAGDPDEESAAISAIKSWRRDNQPINFPNCGSVFTNPPGDSAGRLVDAVGGKGLEIGGARISDVHANFIVTTPDATAADVRTLIRTVQRRVEEEHGVRLRPEVVMVGDFGEEP